MKKVKDLSSGQEKMLSLEALRKKAFGYKAQEIVEEYGAVDGELSLVKRKVTTKDVAPDLAALKAYMESSSADGYENMTLEELEAERIRLINELNAERSDLRSKNETDKTNQKN